MSQKDPFGIPRGAADTPLDPNYSLANLAIETDQSLDALDSAHSGTTEPPGGPVLGRRWIDTGASPHPYKLGDGTNWVTIGTVDVTLSTWTPAGIGTLIAGLASDQTFTGDNTFSGSNIYGQPEYVGVIDTVALGAAAAYTVNNLGSYRSLLLNGYIVQTSASAGLGLRLSVDNGVTVVSSAGSYTSAALAAGGTAAASSTSIGLTDAGTGARNFVAQIDFFNDGAAPTTVRCMTDFVAENAMQVRAGRRQLQEAHNALQVFASAGTITAGAIYIQGWK